ncbi:MAG: AAA family ATPase [Muribaculaceae bacterium]|nr:AAA family ATPase [Muribaculaceae bacterium]
MTQIKLSNIELSLWNKYRVSFHPHPDVNIIVGINGSGKTTLLVELESLVSKNLGKDGPYIFIPSIDNLTVKDGRKKSNALTQTLESYIYYNKEGGSLMYYRMSLIDASPDQADYIRKRIIDFCDLVNSLFHDTDKHIEITGDKFIINANGTLLSIDDLSSGEKQILLLLLRIFLLQDKESIVLIDEPENSLDISWQYKLVDLLVNLNPNAQFFITTHSPSIFGDGWGDRIIYMEDVTKLIEK